MLSHLASRYYEMVKSQQVKETVWGKLDEASNQFCSEWTKIYNQQRSAIVEEVCGDIISKSKESLQKNSDIEISRGTWIRGL